MLECLNVNVYPFTSPYFTFYSQWYNTIIKQVKEYIQYPETGQENKFDEIRGHFNNPGRLLLLHQITGL